ncbi:O-fucosyltransferase 23 [Dionaea muscipula]
MDSWASTKQKRLWGYWNSLPCKCLAFIVLLLLVVRSLLLASFSGYYAASSDLGLVGRGDYNGVRRDKFLEVPQIVWGLNNQKIAFARACLTARLLNRTLLMPSLSASLFYKEIDQLRPVSFDKVFRFQTFNDRCSGFVRLGRYSELVNRTGVIKLQKGSGRKWTGERDSDQLRLFGKDPYDQYEVITIVGKNPFLWHDHWPVKDYASIFECLVLVDEYMKEADRVISRIREVGEEASRKSGLHSLQNPVPYVAVHMRIEKDWMIHCKKMERRSNVSEICSSKEEIIERVGNIVGLSKPTVVYLAVAANLLEDGSILSCWKDGLLPYEKNKLGVNSIYDKYPYLVKSAIDYEVCSRADIFVGNSFSTFSNLIVLERTRKMITMGVTSSCHGDAKWPSYAYNVLGQNGGPHKWMTNIDDVTARNRLLVGNQTDAAAVAPRNGAATEELWEAVKS